jgi:ubiquinol-cytochrome c reductase iron-sulfur subunit
MGGGSTWGAKGVRRAGGPTEQKGTTIVTTMSSAEPTRRDFLYIATGAVGAIGAAATLIPLIGQMNPDASTIAAGAPIEVDLSPIAEGQVIKVFWRSKPIFISHRTKKEIDEVRAVPTDSLKDPQTDQSRVKAGHDQWLVLIGICTHLGCIPLANQGDYDGWFCPCHGSQYDASGRIRKGPAPLNLFIPPYNFVSDTKIQIG